METAIISNIEQNIPQVTFSSVYSEDFLTTSQMKCGQESCNEKDGDESEKDISGKRPSSLVAIVSPIQVLVLTCVPIIFYALWVMLLKKSITNVSKVVNSTQKSRNGLTQYPF